MLSLPQRSGDLAIGVIEPREGVFRGVLEARRIRTHAGCTIMPGELENLPTLLLLRVHELLTLPLKRLDPARRLELLGPAARKPSWFRFGKTAESATRALYPITTDRLLMADGAESYGGLGAEAEFEAISFPMFMTGTIASMVVWGLYIRCSEAG